ncbi:MAG: dTMP kinase [Candidatus Omnitrophota bacterium]|nr:MAG: dTMP kinase [Candidatus Omnitrophota bacterium]
MKHKARKKKSKFITIEGLEGSGKSSIINFLARCLRKCGYTVKIFREPGSTRIGEKIRKILLDKRNKKLSPHTELLLYLAARTQLIEEKLKKDFKNYDVIICDRFFDSTIVYQGIALGLGKLAEEAAKTFSLGIEPHLTILLDAPIERGLARIKSKDRIEARPLGFHRSLRKGYLQLAKRYPRRIKIVDASRSLRDVCRAVEALVDKFIRAR